MPYQRATGRSRAGSPHGGRRPSYASGRGSRGLGTLSRRSQPGGFFQTGCLFKLGAALVVVFVLACIVAFLVIPSCVGGAQPPETEAAEEPKEFVETGTHLIGSTSQDEWEQGVMPYLYQFDPAWADEPYSGSAIWEQGCGPTSLAMVYIYLTGKTDMGPVEMAEYATENGYSTDLQGSSWTLMSEGAPALGLTVEELGADGDRIIAELEEGNPVICIMGPGDFTSVGHYIVLSGVDDDGKVLIHDPNSVVNSHTSWDVDTVVEQAKNIWSFSV